MSDPLAILERAIAAQRNAPAYAKDALWNRLNIINAPVLEERHKLLTFLERAWKHTNENPDVPDREKRDEIWAAKLRRLEQIEDVLATFPDSPSASGATIRRTTPSGTPPTQPSPESLGQPP